MCFLWSYLGAPNASLSYESVCKPPHEVRHKLCNCLVMAAELWRGRPLLVTSAHGSDSGMKGWIAVDPPDHPLFPCFSSAPLSCCILQLCIQLIASVHHRTILENLTLLKHKTADNNVGVIPWGYKLLLNSLIHKSARRFEVAAAVL